MDTNRKLISSKNQKAAIAIMMRFREIHNNISKLEADMKRIQDEKDMLLIDLDLARADDELFQSNLSLTYGPGVLDATKLEWVTKIEENEHTKQNIRVPEDA